MATCSECISNGGIAGPGRSDGMRSADGAGLLVGVTGMSQFCSSKDVVDRIGVAFALSQLHTEGKRPGALASCT
jgi:hypothetical protein